MNKKTLKLSDMTKINSSFKKIDAFEWYILDFLIDLDPYVLNDDILINMCSFRDKFIKENSQAVNLMHI